MFQNMLLLDFGLLSGPKVRIQKTGLCLELEKPLGLLGNLVFGRMTEKGSLKVTLSLLLKWRDDNHVIHLSVSQ